MTTAKDIITGAFARRTANDPERLATTRELIGKLDRALKRVYADVAKVNPFFFGVRLEISFDDDVGGWPRPADAIALWQVELLDGTKVNRVPFRQRFAEITPRIYPLGRNFFTVGEAPVVGPPAIPGDPEGEFESVADILVFFYGKRHPALNPLLAADNVVNTLDDTWPEHYNELLIAELARYLAIKDGRKAEEITVLDAEITELHTLLMQEAQLDDYGEASLWDEAPEPGV